MLIYMSSHLSSLSVTTKPHCLALGPGVTVFERSPVLCVAVCPTCPTGGRTGRDWKSTWCSELRRGVGVAATH